MRTILLLSLMLNFFALKVIAQDSISSSQSPEQESVTSAPPSATTSFVSLTPEMSASSVSSLFSALATATPEQPGSGPSAGDAGSTAGSGGSDAGASGSDSGSFTLSKGGIIAIIVVVVFVVLFGSELNPEVRAEGCTDITIVTSSVLWYLAKKRSWEVRKTIRRSARRVATALTPRRTTFPKDVLDRRPTKGLTRIDEVPPTPKMRGSDVEKGHSKISSFEMSEPPKKSKWAQKLGR